MFDVQFFGQPLSGHGGNTTTGAQGLPKKDNIRRLTTLYQQVNGALRTLGWLLGCFQAEHSPFAISEDGQRAIGLP
jgi:hypothetical protein